MKKMIAKMLSAAKNRRAEKRATTEIKVGEIYHVKHTLRGGFYIKVQEIKGVWVEGFSVGVNDLISDTTQSGEEIIVRRELCTFTKLGDEKE